MWVREGSDQCKNSWEKTIVQSIVGQLLLNFLQLDNYVRPFLQKHKFWLLKCIHFALKEEEEGRRAYINTLHICCVTSLFLFKK